MDPRSEVLLRQRHLFATPLLLAGLPADDLLAELPQAQGWSWHAGEQAQLDARFPGRSRFDTRAPTGAWTSAVLFLPKSRELTDYLLASLAARLPGGELFLVGEKRGGIEIIVHPDVRRMLLTMKAFNEGNRALAYFTAQLLDTEHLSQDAAERERAADLLAFLTPICKAFMTETGQEVTNLGMQVYGGHGYIREWGMEQLVRDCRIAQIYEGTNGIQALDLLGRKVLGSQGKLLRGFTKLVHQLCQAQAEHPQLKGQVAQLAALNAQWGELTQQVGLAAMKNADEVGAASVDYLMFSGYVTLAYFWLRIALVAREKLDAGSGEAAFYEAKLATADFYFSRLLPRTAAHAAAIQAGAAGLMSLSAEQFSL